MAKSTVYPYGTNGELPSSIGLVNDLTTGGVDKALTAEQGKVLDGEITALGQVLYEMFGGEDEEIDPTDYAAVNTTVSSAPYKWQNGLNTVYSRFILLEGGNYELTAGTNSAVYALLTTTNHTQGATPDFLSGYEERYVLQPGEVATLMNIPGGVYLCVRDDTNTATGALCPTIIRKATCENPVMRRQETTALIDSKIEDTQNGVPITPSWLPSGAAIADKNDANFGAVVNSVMAISSYIISVENCYKIRFQIPIYQSETVLGVVFYDSNSAPLTPIKGIVCPVGSDYGMTEMEVDVPLGAKSFRALKLISYTGDYVLRLYLGKSQQKPEIVVAASNSSDLDKSLADYVCSGTNDEQTIKEAFDSLGDFQDLRFCKGQYNIDSLFTATDGQEDYLLCMPYKANAHIRHRIYCDGAMPTKTSTDAMDMGILTNTARFVMSQACYDNLSASKQYSLIRCASNNGARVYTKMNIEIDGLSFILPGNQKNICCIDGKFASQINVKNMMAFATNTADAASQTIGVDGCVGIRGVQGSNIGAGNIIESCFVWGFGRGYEISGEHLICIDLGARFCNYGFYFNGYATWVGAMAHPNTLINCCDECNYNLPYFGKNSLRQSITMIDFNVEWESPYRDKGGAFATEETPGSWRGTINYSIFITNGNVTNTPFWATGCGRGFVSRNDAQLPAADSATIRGYAPNMNQMVYNTTLNKPLICTNPDTKEWRDFTGAVVTL